MAESNATGGILARALAAVRYTFTGNGDWFGPLAPLAPQAPADVAGRSYDYPVGFNLNFRPRAEEPVGFDKLKALAAGSDILRTVIEGQKDKLEAFEWTIKPREKAGGKRGTADAGAAEIQAFLEYPDKVHDWAQWLRSLLEQNFVLDAVSIYRRPDRGGRPYAFEIIDGATIKPLMDQGGRRPIAPDAGFQQVLKGLPAVNYTTAELLYYPQNVRVDHAYGYSRVEHIVTTVETAIERMKSQKAFFRDGNLSDGFFSAPEQAQPDQIARVETMWNNLVTAGVENRRIAQFLPGGFSWNPIGQPPLQDAFDEWLARVICFCFSTSPTPFLKQQGLGHGSAQTDHGAAEAAGLGNTMAYVKRVITRLIREDFGRPDLEFDWIEDREFDPAIKSEIEDRRLKNGSLTLDEVRDRNGEDAYPDGTGAQPLIYTASGATRLSDITDPPEPEPVPAPLATIDDPAGQTPDETDQPKGLAKAASPESRLASTLTHYLKAKGEEIAGALGEKLGLAKAVDPSEGYSGRIDDAFEEVDWIWEDLAPLVSPGIAGMAVAAGTDALSELGLFDKATLAKMSANAASYADARAAEMVGKRLVDGELVDNEGWSIPSATRDMIRSAVTSAIEAGASNDDLAKAIREDDAFSAARAETIARTETAKADTAGTIAGWKASGLVAGKEWLTAPDCCDECQDLNGTVVGIDDEFDDGDPPLHPNCCCTVIAVLPDEMPDDHDD